jgi:ATP-dependent DNA helicase RecQ
MPVGIEAYYQEIGRAGRDGLPADTLTLYGFDDMALRRRQIEEKDLSDAQRAIEHRRLTAMIDLCELAICRRQVLLGYFGEAAEPCGTCDLCRGGAKLYDATIEAQKALSAVARTGQRFGAGHIADILLGEATETTRRYGHDRLKTFGVGKDRSRRAWTATMRQLFAAGALAEASADRGGFKLTRVGEDVLFGRARISLREPSERSRDQPRARRAERVARAEELDSAAAALFERLRALRLEFARTERIAAYMIFPDRTLIEIARKRPQSLLALRALHGVGEAKLARYGEAFLAAVAGSE